MKPTEQTYRQRLLKVQIHIQEHLDEDLSLEVLARLAHFSPFHFHRIFKGIVGEGVREYVRRLRLESAAVALKTTERSVIEVALDAGYGTHEAFTRAFRQMFGVAPSEFRNGQHPLYRQEPVMTATLSNPSVRLETVPTRRLAFLRHVGPYDSSELTFQRLLGWAWQRGLFGPATLVIGLCHDDPEVTPADRIRFDCCITVPDDFQPEGEIGVQTLEGGECAVLTQHGPYNQLGDAYRWLFSVWLPTSGREPGDAPPFEVYFGDPHTMPPEQLRTEIHIPLKRQ